MAARAAATIEEMLRRSLNTRALAPIALAGWLGAPSLALAQPPDDTQASEADASGAEGDPDAPAGEADASSPEADPAAPAIDPPPPKLEPPPPTFTPPEPSPEGPSLSPATPPPESDVEFAVPPPETDPDPEARPSGAPLTFPDPGMAPNDGTSMLVLSGTSIGLVALGVGAGLFVGLRNRVPASWLVPATVVPTVGVLAFAGGGLYLGIQRRRAYRRWETGNRVIGTPQGAGLKIGASFALLAALGFVPAGIFVLETGDTAAGATMVAVGGAAAIATPIMFVLGARYASRYQRTGGWRRRSVPPLPQDGAEARVELVPLVTPLRRGAALGLAGRF